MKPLPIFWYSGGNGDSEVLCSTCHVIPRNRSMPARVVMKAGMPTNATQKPCHAPTRMPTTMAASTPVHHGMPCLMTSSRGHRARESSDGAHRQVDVAADDDDHHADGEHQDVRVLQNHVGQVLGKQQLAVGEDGEEQHDRDEGDEDAALAEVSGEDLLHVRDGGHAAVPSLPAEADERRSCVMSVMSASGVASAMSSTPVMRPKASV